MSLGNYKKSLEYYKKRVDLGNWIDEIFISLYTIGKIKEQLNYPKEDVIQSLIYAFEKAPHRVESLHHAIVICRINNLFQQGYILSKRALEVPFPQGGLFIEKWIYDYALLDEFSISAFYVGKFKESNDACIELLNNRNIPQNYIERVKSNMEFCKGRY